MRAWRKAASIVAVAGLFATACNTADTEGEDPVSTEADVSPSADETTADETSPAAPTEVPVLRLAGSDSGYPSPFGWVRGPGRIYAGYIFDTLLWQDATGDFIPWLATEAEMSDDGLEWRFTLHPDAAWHDGEPVTAEDVAFSFDYITTGAGSDSFGGGYVVIDDVVAEDDQTVVFQLNRPSAAFEEDVAAQMFVIPEHIWADVTDPETQTGPEATIGSGPYKFEAADPATGSYLFVANEDYHLGAPVVKRLEFVPVDDELLGLERGELSAAEVGTEESIPVEQLEIFESNPQFGMESTPGNWNLALHFNMAKGFPYDDVRFRHAMAYGIDRQDMVDRILFGRGSVGSAGALAPTHPFHADGLPTYDHDPEKAAELLDELGMVDADGDGFRDMPDGSPWVQELKASNRFSPRAPELIAEYLREVGVNVEVEILDRASADEAGVQGDYTMQLHGYGGLEGDPDGLRSRFNSEGRSRSFSKAHGYVNETFDELSEQQLVALDPDERRDLIAQMQQILAEDLPVLSIYVPERIMFYDRTVFENWYYTPGCSPCRGSRNKHMYVTGKEVGF